MWNVEKMANQLLCVYTHVKGVGIQLCNYLIDNHSPKVSANGMDELTSPTRQSKASPPSIVVASIQRQID